MITIYRKDKTERFSVSVSQGSIRRFNLTKDDFVKLKFSRETNEPLLIGDFVELTGYIQEYENPKFQGEINQETGELNDQTTKLFVLNRNYYPKYNKSTGGWDYDVQIDAYYKQWNNYILMYDHESGASEASFSLTDSIDKHVSLIIRNLAALGITFKGKDHGNADIEGTPFGFEVHDDVRDKGLKLITYSGVSIYGSLNLIAQTFECEWWMDGGSTIHFGIRKNEGTPISLALNKQIADASTSNSEGTHATRLYAFGGTTNVPKHYRDKLEFNVTDTFYQGTDTTNINVKDSKKPISASWFLNTYKEDGKTFSLDGKTSETELSAVYDSSSFGMGAHQPILRGGNISGEINGLRVKFYPTVYGYKGSDSNEPSAEFKVSFSIGNVKNLVIPTDKYDFPKIHGLNGVDVTLTKNLYYLIKDGVVIRNKNGVHAIFSYPVKAGECYAIEHDRTKTYSVLRVAYSKKDISANLQVDTLWQHAAGAYDSVCVYCEAQDDGYIFCEVTDGYYAPKVKRVNPIEHVIVDGSEHFSVVRSQDWYYFSLYAHVNKFTNTNDELGIKCRFALDDFSISTQREDLAANTTISFGGNDYDAIVNPYFESSEIGHPIKIIGYRPNKNETYELPQILRSKVSEKHGHYFTAKTSGAVNAMVQKNIMLPEGVEYVEPVGMEDFIDNSNVVEAIAVYDWIYPKTDMKVLAVDPASYTLEGGEGEEDEVITTYNIAIQINGFKWENMVTGDKLYTIFQAGSKLSGMRFELEHVSNGTMVVDGKEVEVATFKMIPNEDYSVWLPNDEFKPNVNDIVILDGIDIQYFDMNAIKKAEDEVLAQAKEDLKRMSKEDKVIDVTLRSDDAYNRGRIALGSLVSLNDILSSEVDENGNKKPYESRIIGFEEKLDIPYDSPKYIIGESNYYSTIASIESKIDEVNKGSMTLSGMGGTGSGVTIIKTKDNTKPTDANVFSALRVDNNFLHTKSDDEVEGNIAFNKNISVSGVADINEVDANATYTGTLNVSSDARVGGNQTVDGNQIVKGVQTLHSGFITPNFMEAGGQITGAQLTANGVLTLAGLKAMSFEVFELVYNTIRAQGGKFAFSNSANIESVKYKMVDGSMLEPDEYDSAEWPVEGTPTFTDGIDSVYLKIKKDDINKGTPFVDGDIVYGYVNAIGESGQYARGGQCVMYIINPDEGEVLDDMVVKAILFPIGNPATNKQAVISNIPPTNGMDIAQRGNINPEGHPDRLTSFFIDTETANIYMLSNVTSPTIDKSNYAVVNGQLPTDLYNEIVNYYPYIKSYDPVNYARYVICENLLQFDHLGNPIQRENNRGEWVAPTFDDEGVQINPYRNLPSYYDAVTYNGALWKCVEDETLDEPSKGDGWLLLVARGSDGTSIKVKGSFDSVEELPNTPSDPSDCYIVGQNLYVWDGSKWKNVGQFKGDKGDDGKDGKDGHSITMNLMDNTNFTRWDGNVPERWGSVDDVSLVLVEGKDSGIGGNAISIDKVVLGSLSQKVEVQSSTWYILSFYAKSVGDSISGSISISNRESSIIKDGVGASTSGNIQVSISDQWKHHQIVFSASANETTISFGATRSSTKTLLLSKVKLEVVSDQSKYIQAKSTEWCLSNYDMEGIDGKDGADAISVIAEPAMLNVQVRGEDQLLINNTTHTFTVYARTATKVLSTSDYSISIPPVTNYTFGEPSISNSRYTFTARLADNTQRGDIKPFKVAFTSNDGVNLGDVTVTIAISEKGRAGADGHSEFLSMRGNYDPTVFYKLIYNKDNTIFGRPCVFLPSEKGNGSYLTLKKDMGENFYIEGEDGIIYPMNPDTLEKITPDDSDYWIVTPYQEQVFTKFLLADQAHFGSDKGAIFFDRFLYSQYGINREGNFVPYTDYEDVMWDKNGNLSGEFVPSLMIDMYAGYAKTNKLAETFQAYRRELGANEINFYETYNVKCKEEELKLITTPQANDITDGDVVLVPSQVDTMVDGVRSIILNMADRAWSRSLRATLASGSWQYSEHDEFTSFEQVLSKCMIVCPEPRLFNPYAWKYTKDSNGNVSLRNAATNIDDGGSTIYETGRFVIDGKYTDCIILEPSMQLNLRSCRASTIDKTLYWYVENAEDFVELPYGVRIMISSAYDVSNGSLKNISSENRHHDFGWESHGVVWGYFQRSFVSRNIYELAKSKFGTIKENAQNFRLVVNTQPSVNAIEDNWKWEQDVIGITYEKI